ncbi:MAG: glycosyltransferase family 4 protein [Actinobacteria bacterium]|nr:glycosyltransferase family 4 protein [Actinomycetota bacterium]
MVSHACYVAAYRRKLEEMAASGRVELTLVVPPRWDVGGRKTALEPGHTEGYRMIVEDPVLSGHHHLHFYRKLWRHVAELKPDLMHIDEEPYDFVAFHALRVARRFGTRALFFTWQNLDRTYPPPFSFFERYCLQNSDGAIAGNHEAAGILRRRGFRRPVFEIPQFGIDLATPSKREGDGTFRIGYVGRLVREKGIFVLLEAVAGLDGNWELKFLGDGPEMAQIDCVAGNLGIRDRARVMRAVPSQKVPEMLAEMDVLVLPSLTTGRWKEQFGRVLPEAMSCGVPVVGSDSGEIPNVIGEAGLVFHEGDAEGLRLQLRRLQEDSAFRERLADLGLERVKAHYTHARIAEQTLEAYDKIMDNEV